MGGGVGLGHCLLQVEGLGSVAGLECGDLRLEPLFQAQPVQPDPVEPVQKINAVAAINPRRSSGKGFLFKEQRVDGSRGGKTPSIGAAMTAPVPIPTSSLKALTF